MRVMGGIVNFCEERVDPSLLVEMKRAVEGLGGKKWRADIYGRVGLFFGGDLDRPCEYSGGEGRIALILDGELEGLEGSSDKELCDYVAKEYSSDGEGFLHGLRGSFALILFDEGRGKIIIARSEGRRTPFYYCLTESSLAFADSMAGLTPVIEDTDNAKELDSGSAAVISFGSFELLKF